MLTAVTSLHIKTLNVIIIVKVVIPNLKTKCNEVIIPNRIIILTVVTIIWQRIGCLTWNRVGKSVRVFSDECVLDVSSANTVSSYTRWRANRKTVKTWIAPVSLGKIQPTLHTCCTSIPNNTSVFLLKAGNFTTSSYVTRSSWSNTEMKREEKKY